MEKRDRKMCNLFSSLRLIYRNMFIFLLHSRRERWVVGKKSQRVIFFILFSTKTRTFAKLCFLWLCGTFSLFRYFSRSTFCASSVLKHSQVDARLSFHSSFSSSRKLASRLLKFMNGCWSFPMNAKLSSGLRLFWTTNSSSQLNLSGIVTDNPTSLFCSRV